MPALLFNDGKWNILTSAWSAAAKRPNADTELCYTWSTGQIGFTQSATGTERITLGIPFNVFAAYAADCEKKSEIIDLSDANMPKVLAAYAHLSRR
jgi:hypothetical protein